MEASSVPSAAGDGAAISAVPFDGIKPLVGETAFETARTDVLAPPRGAN